MNHEPTDRSYDAVCSTQQASLSKAQFQLHRVTPSSVLVALLRKFGFVLLAFG